MNMIQIFTENWLPNNVVKSMRTYPNKGKFMVQPGARDPVRLLQWISHCETLNRASPQKTQTNETISQYNLQPHTYQMTLFVWKMLHWLPSAPCIDTSELCSMNGLLPMCELWSHSTRTMQFRPALNVVKLVVGWENLFTYSKQFREFSA